MVAGTHCFRGLTSGQVDMGWAVCYLRKSRACFIYVNDESTGKQLWQGCRVALITQYVLSLKIRVPGSSSMSVSSRPWFASAKLFYGQEITPKL